MDIDGFAPNPGQAFFVFPARTWQPPPLPLGEPAGITLDPTSWSEPQLARTDD